MLAFGPFDPPFLQPVMQVSRRCAIAFGDKLLGGPIAQERLDLGSGWHRSRFCGGPPGLSKLDPSGFLRPASRVRCEIKSRSISRCHGKRHGDDRTLHTAVQLPVAFDRM